MVDCQLSGRLDSNQRPPAPKAGALTGLRYTPSVPSFRYCRRRCRLAAPFAFQNSQNRLLHYAAANRCRLLARRCRPSTVATGPSLPPALAGRASFGSPGCKDNGFFGAHQLFASKSFSGPKGHHRRRNRRPEDCRPEARRIAALPLPRRHHARRGITAEGTARSQVLRPEEHRTSAADRRNCQTVEVARYRVRPSKLPAIASARYRSRLSNRWLKSSCGAGM